MLKFKYNLHGISSLSEIILIVNFLRYLKFYFKVFSISHPHLLLIFLFRK